MTNAKGFTLIEILGVVVILGLLMLIVAPTVLNSISSHEVEVTSAQKQMLEDASDLYLESHNSECIKIQDLIDGGYLNEGFKDVSDKELEKKNIKVNTNNGVHSYNIGGC